MTAPILYWDHRLNARGARLVHALPEPGQSFWRCTAGEWRDVEQSQGRRSVFLEVLDESAARVVGLPIRFFWANGEQIKETETKWGDDYAIDFPMDSTGNPYSVQVFGALSDRIEGLGLGTIDEPWRAALTSYRFTFQRTLADDVGGPVEALPPENPPNIRQAIRREVQVIRASLSNIDELLETP